MFSTRFLTLSVLVAFIGNAFALPTVGTQNLAARVRTPHLSPLVTQLILIICNVNQQHGGAQEESELFLREVARIAALQARAPTPEPAPEPVLKADYGFQPDYKRSPSPSPEGPADDLFAREIARIRAVELQRRDPSSTTTITVGDVTIKQQSKRVGEVEVEARSLDGDGDDSSADLLSAELGRLSGIAKAKREAEKAELLRREIERIAIVTSKKTQTSEKREEVVDFRRTEEGEELLRREIERIAGLQRRSE